VPMRMLILMPPLLLPLPPPPPPPLLKMTLLLLQLWLLLSLLLLLSILLLLLLLFCVSVHHMSSAHSLSAGSASLSSLVQKEGSLPMRHATVSLRLLAPKLHLHHFVWQWLDEDPKRCIAWESCSPLMLELSFYLSKKGSSCE